MLHKNEKNETQVDRKPAVVIKKYANRRLYNTETSTYVTLDDLAQIVRSDRDFVVFDAKTGDDLTHSVLTQIIVEQESRTGGPNLLPIPFLRQLIRFYDDGVARMVPPYLQMSLEALVKEQERFRTQFASAWHPTMAFDVYQEQIRKNMTLFEQAMRMWTPFVPGRGGPGTAMPGEAISPAEAAGMASAANAAASAAKAAGQSSGAPKAPPADPAAQQLAELRAELQAMQAKIEKLSQSRD